MARNSQGVVIRRESSAASSTGVITGTGIAFVVSGNTITNQAGFAALSTGMRVKSNSTVNTGALTIKTTAATAITVYETIAAQASGASITLTGHAMQNIGQVISFNGPSMSANPIDITTLTSTAKEKMPGIYDAGQVAISVLLDNEASNVSLHDALIRDMNAGTRRMFDIKFTEPTTHKGAVYFGGYISGCNISGAVDNALKADITITLDGGVDFINPASS